jgi:hypothetical protein
MEQVLLPNFDGFLILVERLVAVRQAEQRVIVARVMREALAIMLHGFPERASFPGRVAESDEGVIVLGSLSRICVKLSMASATRFS